MTDRTYIVCIGNAGFEALHEIPEDIMEEATLSVLKGINSFEGGGTGRFINSMSLRIRYNSQREIKTYLISADIDPRTFCDTLQHDSVQHLIKKQGIEIQL